MDFILALLGGVAILVLIIVLAVRAGKKRREALQDFASKRGWSLSPQVASEVVSVARDLDLVGDHGGQKCQNLVSGEAGGIQWFFFDHLLTTRVGDEDRMEAFGIALARSVQDHPQMRIRPRHLGDKIAEMVGMRAVQTGNEAFDKSFHVSSTHAEAARAWLSPSVVEWLIAHPGFQAQMSGPWIAIRREGRLGPNDMEKVVQEVTELLARATLAR